MSNISRQPSPRRFYCQARRYPFGDAQGGGEASWGALVRGITERQEVCSGGVGGGTTKDKGEDGVDAIENE